VVLPWDLHALRTQWPVGAARNYSESLVMPCSPPARGTVTNRTGVPCSASESDPWLQSFDTADPRILCRLGFVYSDFRMTSQGLAELSLFAVSLPTATFRTWSISGETLTATTLHALAGDGLSLRSPIVLTTVSKLARPDRHP
jgi:hypothetical protein